MRGVVITGALSALGVTVQPCLDSSIAGHSGIRQHPTHALQSKNGTMVNFRQAIRRISHGYFAAKLEWRSGMEKIAFLIYLFILSYLFFNPIECTANSIFGLDCKFLSTLVKGGLIGSLFAFIDKKISLFQFFKGRT